LRRTRTGFVLVATLLGCQAGAPSRERSTTDTTPPLASVPSTTPRLASAAACLSPDSGRIAFGSIEIAPETEDASGVQFSFQVEDGALKGFYRDARGEIPPELPLQDLVLDTATDTLSFWYGSESGTRYIFRYHFACDQLSGIGRYFVTPTSPGVTSPDTVRRALYISSP